MKYVVIETVFAVDDDFDFREESPLADKIEELFFTLPGICDYTPDAGCSIEHWGSGRIMTEEQYDAKFEDE